MFYCSSGGSEPLSVAKADILKSVITEKLTTAAQEIFAVVERIVTDYEAEASGFRQQVDRQRRQLELLQPRVKLLREEEVPDQLSQVVVSEEQQPTLQTDVEKPGLLDFLWYNDDDEEEEEDAADQEQKEQLLAQPTSISRGKQDHLKDPDYEIPPRLSSRPPSERPGRPRLSDTQNHLDLRVRLLEDCHTQVLSNIVFRTTPVRDLKCPRGLQESEFLDLLRSSFPQLADGEPFDLFTTDLSRKLLPLRVKALTPEDIYSTIRSTGKMSIYVRLKSSGGSRSEDLHPPENPDDEPRSSCAAASSGPTKGIMRLVSAGKRRRGRPRLGEEPSHHLLRLCLLDNPNSIELPNPELQKSSVLDLKCPRGLQEEEFVHLLKSTFPQLVGDDRRFSIYKSDRNKKLQKVRVKSLTPEEIYKNMKSTGIRKNFIYIKVKTGDDEESEEDPEPADGAAAEQEAGLSSSSASECRKRRSVLSGSSALQQQDVDPDQGGTGSGMEFHVGEQALDGDDDCKPELQEKGKASKIPCKVCDLQFLVLGSLTRHAWRHLDDPLSTCGVCAEGFPSSEELKKHLWSHQNTMDCSYCGKTFFSMNGLNNHISLHTGKRLFKCNICNKSFPYLSALNNHHWVHVEDKPHKCDLCAKAFGLRAQLLAHIKTHNKSDRFTCNICGRSLYDLRSLMRHKITHTNERRYGCDVCGKRFKLQGTLRAHEKTHTVRERSYLCHICCKTFVTNSSLTSHMKTHSDARPFVCTICSKGFLTNTDLRNHMRVHTGETPFKCTKCGRLFKLKNTLRNHILTHTGIKRFICSVCGKACSRQEHLNVHMRTHNGERPYKCQLCERAFTQSHCLKTHMKSHQTGKETLEVSTTQSPSV
uniref:C2H2-type domain-containing protein n=2 Tax=Nothobranchius kuhntae TaxID=321403 RepID=A0A1A8HPX6_NOTKU